MQQFSPLLAFTAFSLVKLHANLQLYPPTIIISVGKLPEQMSSVCAFVKYVTILFQVSEEKGQIASI